MSEDNPKLTTRIENRTRALSRFLGLCGLGAAFLFTLGMMSPLFSPSTASVLEAIVAVTIVVGVACFPVAIIVLFLRHKSLTIGAILWLLVAICGSGWITWAVLLMVSSK